MNKRHAVLAVLMTAASGGVRAGNVSIALASHGFGGAAPDGGVSDVAISGDGNFVAFASNSRNLISPSDATFSRQVYVYSRATGAIERISHDSFGNRGDGASNTPKLSSDGRYVAFASDATNLVSGDTNGNTDVFVYDRVLATMTRVSIVGTTQPNGGCNFGLDISADGNVVVYACDASNLVAADTNNATDIFVWNRIGGTPTTTRVNIGASGQQANAGSDYPSISADGNYVSFRSMATNLFAGLATGYPHTYDVDLTTGSLGVVSSPGGGVNENNGSYAGTPLSDDGTYIAYSDQSTNLVSGDANARGDTFVRVRAAPPYNELASVSTAGVQGNGSSTAYAGISGDGRYVSFTSSATNLVTGDTNFGDDIFVRDRQLGTMELVSQTPGGVQANGLSMKSSINSDGHYIVFLSNSNNLTSGVSGTNLQAYIVAR